MFFNVKVRDVFKFRWCQGVSTGSQFLPKETLGVTISEKGRSLELHHLNHPLDLFLWFQYSYFMPRSRRFGHSFVLSRFHARICSVFLSFPPQS